MPRKNKNWMPDHVRHDTTKDVKNCQGQNTIKEKPQSDWHTRLNERVNGKLKKGAFPHADTQKRFVYHCCVAQIKYHKCASIFVRYLYI